MERSVLGRNARDAGRGVELPDRYQVTRMVGVGGMASIWAAKDTLLRRDVAVKVLAEQFAEQPKFVERFEREARTAASLSGHPHVVTIFDVGEHEGRPFIVMEHLPGGTLGDRMSSARPAPADVMRWLGEAASALDFAHLKGVVHRDVKPRNLLFDDLDRLVVADFGIARAAFEDQLTATGELLGTAAYISPEQTAGEPATPASDRYALAVVAYEALTGGLPYGKGTLIELAARRVDAEPPRASERSPDLPPAVDDVLLRGLAGDPASRWETASDFVEALEAAVGQEAPTLEPQTPVPAQSLGRPGVTIGRTRRRPAAAAILLGLAAVAIGLLVGLTLLDDGGSGDDTRAQRRDAQERRQSSAPPAKDDAVPAKPAPAGDSDVNASPAALNDQGYGLMNAGRYAEAIPVLERAVAGFGEKSTDLTYAYALYNLGRSLRLGGRPAEAIPVLERRLAFKNQRGVVKRELAAARRAAGG